MSATPTWKQKLSAACMVLSNTGTNSNKKTLAEALGVAVDSLPIGSQAAYMRAVAAAVLYEVVLGVCDTDPAVSIAINNRLQLMYSENVFCEAAFDAIETSVEEKLFLSPNASAEVSPFLAELRKQTALLERLEKYASLQAQTIFSAA